MTTALARLLLALCVLAHALAAPSSAAAALPPSAGEPSLAQRGWVWPVSDERRVIRHFEAPAHAYGPGHRGVDIAATEVVLAPAAGLVAFSGPVAGRRVLTIDHGDGLVTTFEPIESELTAGTFVAQGQSVGTLSAGGHVGEGTLHFGVRLHGEYVNPLLLLGGVPRAVLLPCC